MVDSLAYLQHLVDHEISSVGISAGAIEGLSLEPAQRALDALGRPDQSYRIIHVTGTNGKGSVCRMAEALIAATGLRVGTYMSPEGTVNERIRIDGHPIDDESLADAVLSVRGVAELLELELTAFEAVTLAALVAFADAPVDVAIVEVGLLGRFDATNIVDGDVAVVTSVGADHTDFREGWLDRVASEKAGIIKARSQAVLGDIDDALVAHFVSEGPESLVRLGHEFACTDDRVALGGRIAVVATSRGSLHEVFVPLHGAHQSTNLAIALEAVESLLGTQLDPELAAAAIEQLVVAGRVEMVSSEPTVILDGAHNPDAARALGQAVTEGFTVSGRRIVVIGMLSGRDPASVLSALTAEFPVDLVVACAMAAPRGAGHEAIAAAADRAGLPTVTAASIADGVARALDLSDDADLILVTGSFRVIEDARRVVAARRSNERRRDSLDEEFDT